MEFQRTVLPGGTRILTEKMREVRSVALGFWVGVGSRDEAVELQGASHFLEHLLFKGSNNYSARRIAEAFDEVGGEANAFSTKEYTCFYGRVLDKDLKMAMDVLLDMLRRPLLKAQDVESERNVILEEIAMHEDTPEDLVHDLFTETIFGSHPLGREVMGTVETVRAIRAQDLKGFHQANYHSPNIVVAAAGNVDHDEIVEWVGAEFAGDHGRRPSRPPAGPEPASKMRVVTRPTEQAHIVVGGMGYHRNHPARFAWGVLDNLLGCGTSSRLFQEVRERRGLAYSVFSYRNSFSETGTYGVYAGTGPNKVFEVLEIIDTELDRLMQDGVTEEELDRVKGFTRGSMVLALEDPASRMSRLGKSELVGAEILSIDDIIARVDAVTTEDVVRVARDLLPADRRVLTLIGPGAANDVAEWSKTGGGRAARAATSAGTSQG